MVANSESGAKFSACRRWRYLLWRRWDGSKPVANFLMLKGPELTEVLSQARGTGVAVLAGRRRTPEHLDALTRVATLAGFLQARLDKSLGRAFDFNDAIKAGFEVEVRASSDSVRVASGRIAELARAGQAALVTRSTTSRMLRSCSRAMNRLMASSTFGSGSTARASMRNLSSTASRCSQR